MTTLSKLKLANVSRKPVNEAPEQHMRGRMIAHLIEPVSADLHKAGNRFGRCCVDGLFHMPPSLSCPLHLQWHIYL